MQRALLATIAVLGLALTGAVPPAAGAAAGRPVRAVWKKHDVSFSFSGFTSHYSCGGFDDTVRLLLRTAGARPGAKVLGSCLSPMGGPEPISMARLSFYALVPASPKSALAGHGAVPIVPAEWKTIHLRAQSPEDLGEGDCELVDQFARSLLPLFTVRDVKNDMSCVPNQINLGDVDLRFRVLVAMPQKKRGQPARR